MQTIAIIAQKGGVGKTTLAVHLAFYAAMKGKAVVFLDTDLDQGTGADWIQEREKQNELVATKATADQIGAFLRKAEEGGADLVVIDTAPTMNRAAVLVADKADFILVPCKPSKGDMKTMPTTIDIIERAKTPYAIVLNQTPQGSRADQAASLLRQNGFNVLETQISRRVALDYCNDDGRTIFEFEPDNKATLELERLFQEIMETMDIKISRYHDNKRKGAA